MHRLGGGMHSPNALVSHFLRRFKYSTSAQLGKNGSGPVYSGTLGMYGPGGFVRELKPTTFKTVHYNVDELYTNKWIDHGTRAVFLELAVWNPRLYILCSIKYVVIQGVFSGLREGGEGALRHVPIAPTRSRCAYFSVLLTVAVYYCVFLCTSDSLSGPRVLLSLIVNTVNKKIKHVGFSLAHLPLPLWRSTTALSVTHHPVSGVSFPRNFACLLIMKTYHSHLISHMSVRHFLHHHCRHPSLLSATPDSKLIFSTYPFLHIFATFPPTGLTQWTPAVFCFSRACRFQVWHCVLG